MSEKERDERVIKGLAKHTPDKASGDRAETRLPIFY